MEGFVKVYFRLRPATNADDRNSTQSLVEVDEEDNIVSLRSNHSREGDSFGYVKSVKFVRALMPHHKQDVVYDAVARPLIKDVLNGCCATVLAYGQTGSGKTWTIFGPDNQASKKTTCGSQANARVPAEAGIIPRAAEDLFDAIRASEDRYHCTVQVSLVQIYMEILQDMITGTTSMLTELPGQALRIREDPQHGTFVENLSCHVAHSAADVKALVERGYARRCVEATQMNDVSSRSHVVLRIKVTIREMESMATPERHGSLQCVDLAGSESIKKSGSVGLRAEEAKSINLSLLSLGNVISTIAQGGTAPARFRDSKLTRLLQDSLVGRVKTVMVINAPPGAEHYRETLSSLQFAERAIKVRLLPRLPDPVRTADQMTIMTLEAKLAKYEDSPDEMAELIEYISDLEQQLEDRAASSEWELKFEELKTCYQRKCDECSALLNKLGEAEDKIRNFLMASQAEIKRQQELLEAKDQAANQSRKKTIGTIDDLLTHSVHRLQSSSRAMTSESRIFASESWDDSSDWTRVGCSPESSHEAHRSHGQKHRSCSPAFAASNFRSNSPNRDGHSTHQSNRRNLHDISCEILSPTPLPTRGDRIADESLHSLDSGVEVSPMRELEVENNQLWERILELEEGAKQHKSKMESARQKQLRADAALVDKDQFILKVMKQMEPLLKNQGCANLGLHNQAAA